MNQLYLDRLSGAISRGPRTRRAPRSPRAGAVGLSLALHAGAGVVPFAIIAAAGGPLLASYGTLAALALAAVWFVGSWVLFDLTHEAMYGR